MKTAEKKSDKFSRSSSGLGGGRVFFRRESAFVLSACWPAFSPFVFFAALFETHREKKSRPPSDREALFDFFLHEDLLSLDCGRRSAG